MKKLVLIIVLLVMASSVINGQVAGDTNIKHLTNSYEGIFAGPNIYKLHDNMHYKDLKKIYNFKFYERPEGTKPCIALYGIGSFLIPGLGQVCAAEPVRALAFFLPAVAIVAVDMAAFSFLIVKGTTEEVVNGIAQTGKNSSSWKTMQGVTIGCGCLLLGTAIWSSIDAVRVAKIRTMYKSDMRKLYGPSYSLELYPSIQTAPTFAAAPSLTLALRF